MRECDVNLEIDCPPERFWALYFDPGFQLDTFLDGLRWDAPNVSEFRKDEREIVRNLSAHPRIDIPGKIARLIGEKLGYQEWGRFDRKSAEFSFRHRTNIFGDKLAMSGKMWGEPIAGGRMRWRTRLTIDCSVLGLGGVIERTVEHNVYKSWPQCSDYWNRWIAKHPDRVREAVL